MFVCYSELSYLLGLSPFSSTNCKTYSIKILFHFDIFRPPHQRMHTYPSPFLGMTYCYLEINHHQKYNSICSLK
jgi:hypothetical protein